MEGCNNARGDVTIALEGRVLLLRPTFAAIVQLEAHYTRSIFDVARGFAGGELARAGDLPVLVKAGLMGAGQDVPDDLENLMLRHGLARFLAPLGQFLAHACGLET